VIKEANGRPELEEFLTETREITPYKWVHPDEERRWPRGLEPRGSTRPFQPTKTGVAAFVSAADCACFVT